MGLDFIRKAAKSFHKRLDQSRIDLLTPHLFTQQPSCEPRAYAATIKGVVATNRDGPARGPPTGSSPVEAIRHGSAELGHPIEDRTAEDDLTPLPGWPPGPEALSDHGRVAEARVLHPALTMGH